MHAPEVLSPAGNLEKLKTAILYGADAVYMAGQKFGLRALADNHSEREFREAVRFVHAHGKRIYVTINAFLYDQDLVDLADYCAFLEELGVDAVIVSDFGVVRLIRRHSSLPIHLSTQASCLNSEAIKFWKGQGVERIITGRELSIAEGGQLREINEIEIEMFIHGAMCMAYSGNCTISNFTAGRDSNRGGCVQSCRFLYEQVDEAGSQSDSHFMSSKDLNGVRLVPEFIEAGISSLKIEGRMKSVLYAATTARVYRRAVDAVLAGSWSEELVAELNAELQAVPHRRFTEASLEKPAGVDSIYHDARETKQNSAYEMFGAVLETTQSEMLVRMYRSVEQGTPIEVLPFNEDPVLYQVDGLRDVLGRSIEGARQDMVVWMARPSAAERSNVIRCEVSR